MKGKIEKAIVDRHGEEAIQDPMNFWDQEKEEEYRKQYKKREKKIFEVENKVELSENVYITKKLITNKDSNDILFKKCNKCKKESKRNIDDDVSFLKHDCCYQCYIQYIEPEEQRKRAQEELEQK